MANSPAITPSTAQAATYAIRTAAAVQEALIDQSLLSAGVDTLATFVIPIAGAFTNAAATELSNRYVQSGWASTVSVAGGNATLVLTRKIPFPNANEPS